MLSSAKQGIKQLLNAAGIEVHWFHPDTSPLARLMAALRAFGIDLIQYPAEHLFVGTSTFLDHTITKRLDRSVRKESNV
jgi:hypothetical protein